MTANDILVPGSLREQLVGIREGDVPRQPVCPVLLPPRLCLDPHGHCRGQAPGESPLRQADRKDGTRFCFYPFQWKLFQAFTHSLQSVGAG